MVFNNNYCVWNMEQRRSYHSLHLPSWMERVQILQQLIKTMIQYSHSSQVNPCSSLSVASIFSPSLFLYSCAH